MSPSPVVKPMSDTSQNTTGPEPGQFQEVVEGLRVRLVPAPRFKRVLALATDLGLITVGFYLLFIVAVFLFAGVLASTAFLDSMKNSGGGVGVAAVVVFLVILLATLSAVHAYFIYFEYKKGATPGKKLFGMKVVSVDGSRLTMRQVVIRELLRSYVDLMLLLPALIAVFLTDKRQRIGDLAANTMVVYSKAKEDGQQFLYVKQEDYHLLLEYLRPEVIPEEFREAYLRFAYQEFVVRLQPAPSMVLEDWNKRVRTYLPQADALGLNQTTVLRFFAEYCFQSANEKIQKS